MLALPGRAAPYAELVMDARTGEILRSSNAETRLHPASLTKMLTLYIAFEAVRRGEITLDTEVRISRNAAAEPPSKLGLRSGQKIAFRYLIRAAAVKSANDAATAIGEAISGSEAAFAERMNRTARALGMTDSTFRNAHGLTASGHLSTARDMSVMGRRLFYDYPEYYNLFSRRTTDASVTQVRNTNRRLLNAYRGADGIKTGYTNAAGFNLVASAERGGVRIIATVFGGRSTATRNARIAELLDIGFQKAPRHVTERRPSPPVYGGGTLPGPSAPVHSMRPVMRGLGAGGAALYASASTPTAQPAPRPAATEAPRVIVTRASTAGRDFGIQLNRQGTRSAADKLLLRTALQELDTLDDALRRVDRVRGGFAPSFVGLSERDAQRACTRLRARAVDCSVTFGS
ncbi:D-alanyl-D-alanine carboxypeptidase [Jannaschia sp. S6380]|uniref:D-alanyl-D-alanine carboxypeptidase family protein n=1 Tax=Jannaschia sp. S6380 TaxID=2926408 RepID=UPI001FF41422|nr:D-alanyl-D-alanine carboxypeptidase family protein [Jannaschia sp. S6380]MCK0169166.1 D-alanyl-D-alanine carboxypeptidase [Jannaschia sp. S6380]